MPLMNGTANGRKMDLTAGLDATRWPDADLEREVLGGILRWPATIDDVLLILGVEDFSTDAHQKIWASVVVLHERGAAVVPAELAEHLYRAGHIANIGYGYLKELWELVPTGANAVYYAGLVRERSILRRLSWAGNEICENAAHPTGPVEEILADAERRIFAIAEAGTADRVVHISQAINEAADRCDRIAEARRVDPRRLSGIPCGLADVDRLTLGFQDGEFVVIAARPSAGKTSLGLCLARYAAVECRLPIFFVSLEQSRVELAERLMCAEGGVDSWRIRSGRCTSEDMANLLDAARVIRDAPMFIDDTAAQNMLRVGANARRLRRRHGIRLVVLDYLQLVTPDNRRDPRHEQVAGVSRRLKTLARELNVPVVALAQLNRQVEERQGRPRLSDLRDSGAIEQDADVVLLLHRPPLEHGEEPGAVRLIEVHLAKQRNGPTGEITLAYRPACFRFENYAPIPI